MKVRRGLLAEDFYEDPVGELAVDEVNHAVFDEAFEDLALLWGSLRGWPWCGGGRLAG
jgi:hypothetical protein